ncbi:hypothetical protein ACFLY8_05150 [Halobacteriota archaeon]
MFRGHKDLADHIKSFYKGKIIDVLYIVIIITVITIIAVVIVTASPGPTYWTIPINASAGGTDNQSEWNISVVATAVVNETVNLSINETDSNYDYDKLKNASFSESNFTLTPNSTKNVTLTMTIYDGTTPGNYTIKVDLFSLEEGMPPFAGSEGSTILYIEVQSTIDATAPDVTAITLNQWYANNSVVTLNASINDSPSGVKNATVNVSAINSTLNEVILTKQNGDYWTNTTIIADRGNTVVLQNLTITAYDNVSNVNDSVNMTVGIDENAPSVSAITIGVWTANNSVVTLNASINDSQSGVKNATVNVSLINSTINEAILIKQQGVDYWTNTTIIADKGDTGGLQNLTITAYDNVSNCNNSVNMTVEIGIDETPPTITIDVPTESAPVYKKSGEQFWVNFTYTEGNPANYTVEVRNSTAVINSSLNESVVGGTSLFANHSFNLNLTAADGRYNVTVKMYDNVSLSYTTYQNYSVIKDDTLPTITTPPDQTVEVDSTNYITWNVTDNDPKNYWVLRNGVEVVAPTAYTSGVDVNVQIDTSTLRTWNYTIFANDTTGNVASDEVIITVVLRPLAFPEFNSMGLLALISILSITLAVTTLRRER